FEMGSSGYQLGVDEIPLPDSSTMQKIAAWGSTSGFPTSNGVYTPPGGGIYIRGDSKVLMQVDGSGNQVFKVTQGSTVTTITVDLVNNVIKKKVGSGPTTTTAGSGTGVLYCTGNIT